MVGLTVNSFRNCIVVLSFYVSTACSHYVGVLAAGDLKRINPLVIKRYSQNSPVFINIKSESAPLEGYLKLTDKSGPKLSLLDAPSPKFTRSIISPAIPKLPYVPYILPLIPNLPYLPIFPWPDPKTSGLSKMALPTKLDRITPWGTRNSQILGQLLHLKQRGSLTTSEYVRMKNLLYK